MFVRYLCISLIGAAVVVGLILLFAYQSPVLLAQDLAQQLPRPSAKGAPPAAPTPVAPATPAGPVRTETTAFDTWTVTCREVVGGNVEKACAATLTLQLIENNQRQVLGAWIIGRNNDGVLLTVLQTPIFRTQTSTAGVLISKGVEFKLGNGAVRKIDYVACEPQRCEASTPMDEAMVKEVINAPNATITVYNKDGTALNINVPSIKGVDKALAAIPANRRG